MLLTPHYELNSHGLPQAYVLAWYETYDTWLGRKAELLRHAVAARIEARAKDLGLVGFKSSVRPSEDA